MDVIDTTVFAYALLGEPAHKDEALAVLEKAKEIAVPDIFRAEFANVIWKWVEARRLSPEEGLTMLTACQPLIAVFFDGEQLWESALLAAIEQKHPVYDGFYVALARNFGGKVVTYDKRLRTKYSADTISPGEFLSLL